MKKYLKTFGFTQKEIDVYMYLSDYGVSAASEISKNIGLPKSSINFLADNLWNRGFLKKSFRGKTGYYEVDILMLENTLSEELSQKEEALKNIIPLLKEKGKNIISKPKILFIDGIESCKQHYLKLLDVEKFYEFGTHADLVTAFGEKFMDDFIKKRLEMNVFCDSIGSDGEVELALQKKDSDHNRKLSIFSSDNFGKIHSSIAIFENKVLILNLNNTATGVLIENNEFSETMKTIFMIGRRGE